MFSKRKLEQFSKPKITTGIRRSIEGKKSLFNSGDTANYKIYPNKITTLKRKSKRHYHTSFFQAIMKNMENTRAGINQLINGEKKKSKPISSLGRIRRVLKSPWILGEVLEFSSTLNVVVWKVFFKCFSGCRRQNINHSSDKLIVICTMRFCFMQ